MVLAGSGFPSERAAVSMLFLANGFLIGNWAAHIPEFAFRLSLGETRLGVMIAVFGAGSLVSMPIAGVLVALKGHAVVTRILAIAAATSLVWIYLSAAAPAAFVALFLFGAFIASMDVAMNATAVEVERGLGAPIMSSCHGFWSLGGLVGAFAGGAVVENFGAGAQIGVATIIAAGLVALALTNVPNRATGVTEKRIKPQLPRTLLPYLVGLIALFSAMPEGAAIDWSALYMRKELGADAFVSSWAFAAFSAAMALVRFAGDPIRKRLGAVVTARWCAGIAAAGFLLAGLAPTPGLAIAGFAITGLGLSNLVPIAFSAAGNLPGMAQGIGLAVATTIGYSGVLVFPAILGTIAERSGFSQLFVLLSLPLLVVLFFAGTMKYADRR